MAETYPQYSGCQHSIKKFDALQKTFTNRRPTLADVPEIEKLLVDLRQEDSLPLDLLFLEDSGSGICKLCAVDIDNNGREEVVTFINNGTVLLYSFPPSPKKPTYLKANRTIPVDRMRIVGFVKKEGFDGFDVGLIALEGETTRHYYNIFLTDDESRLELNRRPQFRPPVAVLAQSASQRQPSVTVEVLQVESPEGPSTQICVHNLPGQGKAVFTAPFTLQSVVFDNDGLVLGGARTRLIHLPFSRIQGGAWTPDPDFDGQVGGYVTSLAGFETAAGQPLILAACEDGRLHAIDRQSGRLLWARPFPDLSLSVETGDVDGDGRREIIVGGREGHLSVWKECPEQQSQISACIETALHWAIQAAGAETLYEQWYLADVPALRALADQIPCSPPGLATVPSISKDNKLLLRIPSSVTGGSIETLNAFSCEATGQSWLLAATHNGRLILLDLNEKRVCETFDLGESGPARSIISAPFIDALHPEVSILTADGTVRLYLPETGMRLSNAAGSWKVCGEAWSMLPLPGSGERTYLTGNDRGILEISHVVDGQKTSSDRKVTGSHPLHDLALMRDIDGHVKIAASDRVNQGFNLFPLEDISQKTYVALPQVIVDLLSWPSQDGSMYCAAVCADQRVFVFNEWGELIHIHFPDEPGPYVERAEGPGWPHGYQGVCADIFQPDPSTGDPLLLTAAGSRMVVYERSGARLRELYLGKPVAKIEGFHYRSEDNKHWSAGIACATPEGEILLYSLEGLQPNAITNRKLLTELLSGAGDGPISCRQVFACPDSLGESQEAQLTWIAGQAIQPETFENLEEDQRVCFVETLVRILPYFDEVSRLKVADRLNQILYQSPEGAQYDRRMLMAITKQEIEATGHPPSTGWRVILDQLALSQDAITLRGLAQMAVRALTQNSAEPYWWRLIQAISTQEATSPPAHRRSAKDAAREAIALHLRNLHRPKLPQAWQSTHQYLEHGMDPGVLQTLARIEVPLIIKEPQLRDLYDELCRFMNSHEDEKLEALQKLCRCIEQQARWMKSEPIAETYRALERIGQVKEAPALRAEIDTPWIIQAVEQIRTGSVEERFETFNDAINDCYTLVRSGLSEHESAPSEKRLDLLRELSKNIRCQAELVVEKYDLAKSERHYTTANWLECLALIMKSWVDEGGWLGQRISRLTREFDWDVDIQNPRYVENQFQAEFKLKNVGFVPAFDPQMQRVDIIIAGRTITGEGVLDSSQQGNLTAGEQRSGKISISLPEPSGQSFDAPDTVRLVLQIRPPRSGDVYKHLKVEKEVSIASRRKHLDYPNDFPGAWKVYERRMHGLLRRSGGVIFVELDRTARPSFFQACLALAPVGEGRLINLRRVFQEMRSEQPGGGKALKVRPEDLFEGIARQITDPGQTVEFGATYRSQFAQICLGGPRPVTRLFLDQFDALYQGLLEEEGSKVLKEFLESLVELAQKHQIQLILGGSMLVRKLIQHRDPGLYQLLNVVRADDLSVSPTAASEITRFVEREKNLRSLGTALNLFNQPGNLLELAGWCGSNLHYLRIFLLDGLEQALRDDETPALRERMATLTPLQYLLEYENQQNFFRHFWVALSFFEKITLALLAQAQFTIDKKELLVELAGLRLSQPYRPPRAPDRYTGKRQSSRKVPGAAGQILDDALIAKIRSSKFFEPGDVWISGYAVKNPLSFDNSRTGLMLWRMVRALQLEPLLQRFEDEGIIGRHSRSRDLGDIYLFRVPLLREFLLRSGAFERMTSIAGGSKHTWWYPEGLFPDTCLAGAIAGDKTFEPVYRQIAPADLVKLHAAFQDSDDLDLFLNFYDMAGSADLRRRRWEKADAFARAIKNLDDHFEQLAEDEARRAFEGMNDLLGVHRAEIQSGFETGPARIDIHSQWAVWQNTYFDEQVFPGLRKNLLIIFVKDGSAWDQASVNALREWARRYLDRADRQEQAKLHDLENEGSDGNDKGKRRDKWVIVLIALQNARSLEQCLREGIRQPGLHEAVLGDSELGELFRAEFPARTLISIIQRQVGRLPFSPYMSRGPLSAGSPLFVGRTAEITRIWHGLDRNTYIILGSRRIGKTSLLRQIQNRLSDNPHFLPLWVGSTNKPEDFFSRIQSVLQATSWPETAALIGSGAAAYEGLRQAITSIRDKSQKLPVLLMDEIDALYAADLGERLFLLLRDMNQETPALCRLVMTGYRQIYLRQFDYRSAFFNFGEGVFLREVEDNDLAYLINLLKKYGVNFYSDNEARRVILEETYGVPYLVQSACEDLLERLDRKSGSKDPDRVDLEDIYGVLRKVEQELYKELLGDDEEKNLEGANRAQQVLIRQRLRILLFATVLGKYPYSQEQNASFRPLPESERYFTARNVVDYLKIWANQVIPAWPFSYEEVFGLLQELQMTLALAVDSSIQKTGMTDSERRADTRFYFPRDIIPRLLHNYFKGGSRGNIIDSLSDTIQEHIRWVDAAGRRG